MKLYPRCIKANCAEHVQRWTNLTKESKKEWHRSIRVFRVAEQKTLQARSIQARCSWVLPPQEWKRSDRKEESSWSCELRWGEVGGSGRKEANSPRGHVLAHTCSRASASFLPLDQIPFFLSLIPMQISTSHLIFFSRINGFTCKWSMLKDSISYAWIKKIRRTFPFSLHRFFLTTSVLI